MAFSTHVVATSTLIALLALVACGTASDGGTSGKRVAFTVKVTGSPEAKAPFTNAQGWTIGLTKAVIGTGALYFYDGATIFSRNESKRRSPSERLWEALGERTAFAHPGHYIPGNARGEYLNPAVVDLRGDTVLGQGNGVSGLVRSATFSFLPSTVGPLAAEIGSHVAVLEGTASKGAETRIFRADIDAADIQNTKQSPAVEGCPFEQADVQADGTVTVTINVRQWFDQVEFDSMPKSADGRPVTFPTTAIGRSELVRGMKAGLAYNFKYDRN